MSSSTKRVAVLAIVVENNDEPIYLKDLRGVAGEDPNNADEYLFQFILHSSLDMVSEKQWQTPSLYLGVVETFREYSVSAWITASGTRILLLHRGYTEATVKNFLKGVHVLWVRAALNPLMDREDRISSTVFDNKLNALTQKVLVPNQSS